MTVKSYGILHSGHKCLGCGREMHIGHFPPDNNNEGLWFWECPEWSRSNDCPAGRGGLIPLTAEDIENLPDEFQKLIQKTDDRRIVPSYR